MYCNKCGTQNPDDVSVCSECGSNIVIEPEKSNSVNKKSTFEQLDIISEEVEKLDFIYKLGFYISGFGILFVVTLYSVFIAPFLIYLLGGRGWPKNILVKAVLYYTVVSAILLIVLMLFVVFAVFAGFVFGIGKSQI